MGDEFAIATPVLGELYYGAYASQRIADNLAKLAYLAEQKGKLPSEVKAYFVDEQGFTVRYADEVPTARTRRRMEKAKQEIAEGKGLSLEEVRQRLTSR